MVNGPSSCSCRSPGHTSLNLGQSGAAAVAIFVLQASLKPTYTAGPWGQQLSVSTAFTQCYSWAEEPRDVANIQFGPWAGQTRGQFLSTLLGLIGCG